MTTRPAILIFQFDLRVHDNPALHAAIESGHPVIAVFVNDDTESLLPGGASRWWLHHSLINLRENLQKIGLSLLLKSGSRLSVIKELCVESNASAIFWNRRYDPDGVKFGTTLKSWAKAENLIAESFRATLLHEPSNVTTKAGQYFKVFTPFWRNFCASPPPRPPLPIPSAQNSAPIEIESESLDTWELCPTNPNWAHDFGNHWQPGETGALAALDRFIENRLDNYAENRDFPDIDGTSRLSPHLRFGEISPFLIHHRLENPTDNNAAHDRNKFLAEVGWREFSHHLLHHNPDLKTKNFKAQFDQFPWQASQDTIANLTAWQRGQTGYPIVDAGMRELWQTGYMHNRVRMIVGSFLVKHLLIDWREGEKWFWDTLLDACPANNSASWQWIAGCGADASPYYRIFNPILQGEKFDPKGHYVRKFVPEVAVLPDNIIHKPWEGTETLLRQHGIILGETYPKPIVNHVKARERALSAFNALKERSEVVAS